MKKAIFGAWLLFSCLSTYAQSPKQLAADFKKLDWLTGNWKRTNGKPGSNSFERWARTSALEMQGASGGVRGQDTTFTEKLKLVTKDGHIYYVADVPQNTAPVWFKLTAITDDSFTCENPENDFPKKITYQKTGNTVKAVISANGKSVDFLFERSDQKTK